jgi:glutamate carboxypeptidase
MENSNYLQDLEKICKINSFTKNKIGVDEVSFVMESFLSPLGFDVEYFNRDDIGNHQLFTSKKTDNSKKILLLGHNDTVFAPSTFDKYHEDDDWVYGPGVCDMKGGNIVALQSLRNIYQKNKKIENIDFLLVSDEETGSDDSKFITLDLAKNYDYCFVFEAAGQNLEIVTQRKGVGTFSIEITGKASHAGVRYKDGINANLEASYKLQELTKLTNLEIGTTVNVGLIDGGIGANTISPKCKLTFEIRYETVEEKDRLLKAIDKIVNTSYVEGTTSILSGLIQRDVMQENQEQLDLIKKLEDITDTKIPIEHRGGVSDANHVASVGVITLDGWGPFGDGDHTVHERALKSSFEIRIKQMTEILEFHQANKTL